MAAAVAALALAPAARADSFSWTGAATANWNNAGNWTGGGGTGIPGGGASPPDSIAFDGNSTNVANLATTNDVTGLSLAGISVTTPAGPVGIAGNAFTLGAGGIDMSAATQDLTVAPQGSSASPGLTLGANQTWAVNAGRTLTVDTFIAGPSFGITKTGGGTLSLPTSSNSTGSSGYGNGVTAMTILGGIVTMPNGNSLGTNTNTTPNNIVINGGTLQFTVPAALNASRGIGLGSSGGAIDIPIAAPNGFQINSVIADAANGTPGGLTKTGTGLLILNAANTFTGGTTVSAGTLALRNAAALGGRAARSSFREPAPFSSRL